MAAILMKITASNRKLQKITYLFLVMWCRKQDDEATYHGASKPHDKPQPVHGVSYQQAPYGGFGMLCYIQGDKATYHGASIRWLESFKWGKKKETV